MSKVTPPNWPLKTLTAVAGVARAYQGYAMSVHKDGLEIIVMCKTRADLHAVGDRFLPDFVPVNDSKVHASTMFQSARAVIEGDDEL